MLNVVKRSDVMLSVVAPANAFQGLSRIGADLWTLNINKLLYKTHTKKCTYP